MFRKKMNKDQKLEKFLEKNVPKLSFEKRMDYYNSIQSNKLESLKNLLLGATFVIIYWVYYSSFLYWVWELNNLGYVNTFILFFLLAALLFVSYKNWKNNKKFKNKIRKFVYENVR